MIDNGGAATVVGQSARGDRMTRRQARGWVSIP